MSLFGLGKKKDTLPTSNDGNASTGVDLGKRSGAISLSKGERVTIDKTPTIRAIAQWSSKTDYDLYALVLMKDGRQYVVSTFGSQDQPIPTPSILQNAVTHLGDVGREAKGVAEEIIEIRMTDDIEAVVPVAYSAQSNGVGSFRQYKVGLSIDNGAGTQIGIDARHGSRNPLVYSLAIGIIRNTPEGVVIEHIEKYSKAGSEARPAFKDGQLVMDAGSINLHK